ncbi:MAG: glycosyltransferase family 1 protein [Cryomorphaceae bacterium]|nr:MAG: glycosyltransferase family 1 protein [Cryomorphaceae bacterium]
MKIALLTDGIFPDVMGGMQKHSYFLARFLSRSGVEVDLYYTSPDSSRETIQSRYTEDEKSRIYFHRVEFPKSIRLPGHYVRSSWKYSQQLYRLFLKNEPPDLIYAQGLTCWAFAGAKQRGKLNTPLLSNLHGLEMFQPALTTRTKLEQKLLRGPARFIILHSDYCYSLGGKLTEILGAFVPQNRIIVQSIGLDSKWLSTESSTEKKDNRITRFVFVGRNEARKGLQYLFEASKYLDNHYAHIDFVGPIPPQEQVSSPLHTFHGAVSDEERLKQILDGCDVLLCPSLAEGMPTVILEAMARGLAVIASDVGAVAELVNTKTGWLIKPGRVDELAAAMKDACTDLALSQKKSAAQQLIRSRFTWEKVVKDTISGFEEILRTRSGS